MKVGISTASLFGRYQVEQAISYLSQNKVPVVEVFLESYCEYNKEFGKLINTNRKDTEIHSVHVLTTQFEPQLYSLNARAKQDSFILLDMAMQSAEEFKAKYYTFHGGARFKKTPFKIDYERVSKITQEIIDTAKKHNVTLAYENVHWGYYNYIGFFEEIRKRTNGLKATLDIKQARQSDIHYKEFINEMKDDIVTVHLSDITEQGKMCLPGKGTTDFYDLFSRLKDVGFNGALLIESYQSDFNDCKELFESMQYVNELADKVF